MRLPTGSSAQAPVLDAGEWGRATPLPRARVSPRTVQRLIAVAILPMVAATVWLAHSSDHLERPVASALYWSYLTAAPMMIGLYWWVRRPASRFGPLLVRFGVDVLGDQSGRRRTAPLPFDLACCSRDPCSG